MPEQEGLFDPDKEAKAKSQEVRDALSSQQAPGDETELTRAQRTMREAESDVDRYDDAGGVAADQARERLEQARARLEQIEDAEVAAVFNERYGLVGNEAEMSEDHPDANINE